MITQLTYYDKLIISRTAAYSLISPLDVFRQNKLINKNITNTKIIKGFILTGINSIILGNTRYKTLGLIIKNNLHISISIMLSVIIMNILATPLIYNYKSVVTENSMELVKLKKGFNIYKLSLIDGFMEELMKYYFSTKLLFNPNRNKILDATLVGLTTYPVDILKSKITYNNYKLYITHNDFVLKVIIKLIQNYLFLIFSSMLT